MLSIILVHYKTYDLTKTCIESIFKYNNVIDFEIIIIDNNSEDNIEKVTFKYNNVYYYNTGYNSGFSRANNYGIYHSRGDFLLFLNTDTLSLDNSISECYSRLKKSEDLSFASVLQVDKQLNPLQTGNYFVIGGLNFLINLPYWGNFIYWIGKKFTKLKTHNDPSLNDYEYVDWISGAFLMISKAKLFKIGLWDEDFFLYGEEVELCSRAKKEGKLIVYNDLKNIHLIGGSNEDKSYELISSKKGKQIILSNWLSIRKRLGVFWFFIHLLNYLISFFISILLLPIFYKKRNYFLINFMKNLKYIPKIVLNSQYFYKHEQ